MLNLWPALRGEARGWSGPYILPPLQAPSRVLRQVPRVACASACRCSCIPAAALLTGPTLYPQDLPASAGEAVGSRADA